MKLLSKYLENPEITEITQEDLQKFMVWLKTEYKPRRFSGDTSPLSGATQDNYWIAIRSFFTWASREFTIRRPDRDLERPKYQSDPIEPFTRAEIEKLLQACKFTAGTENRYKRPTSKRDQVIIMLLLDTGIRRGELERLRMEDLTKDDRSGKYKIRIRPYRSGVKSQSRIVYAGKSTSRYLWRYLADREMLYDEDQVFKLTQPSAYWEGCLPATMLHWGTNRHQRCSPPPVPAHICNSIFTQWRRHLYFTKAAWTIHAGHGAKLSCDC